MNQPIISIVMPAYNAGKFLARTVESVVAQTYVQWELVIVDDGSTDDTWNVAGALAASDPRIQAHHKENGGVACARNYGISRATPTSPFLIMLDHDDIWMPDALETLMSALEKDPVAVAAHGLARKSDYGGTPGDILGGHRRKIVSISGRLRIVECSNFEPTTFAVLAYDGCLCTPGMALIRRNSMDDMPLFQQHLAPSDDFDFWVRMSLRGHFVYVDKVVIEWRQHGANVSHQESIMPAALSKNHLLVVHMPELTAEQRRVAFWRYKRMYASVVRHNSRDFLTLSADRFAHRRLVDFGRFAAQALSLYAQYICLCWFWKQGKDHGPLPARIKDSHPDAERISFKS